MMKEGMDYYLRQRHQSCYYAYRADAICCMSLDYSIITTVVRVLVLYQPLEINRSFLFYFPPSGWADDGWHCCSFCSSKTLWTCRINIRSKLTFIRLHWAYITDEVKSDPFFPFLLENAIRNQRRYRGGNESFGFCWLFHVVLFTTKISLFHPNYITPPHTKMRSRLIFYIDVLNKSTRI